MKEIESIFKATMVENFLNLGEKWTSNPKRSKGLK